MTTTAALIALLAFATKPAEASKAPKLHHERSTVRFCKHHPKAHQFCTWRRLEHARLNLWRHYFRPDPDWYALSKDFETAVYHLARHLRLPPSLARWVLTCADSEGGRGAWVPNRGGSGAGGWLQFLSGTFYSNASAAWKFASARGVPVPRRYLDWHSTIGQALTGLYMFSTQGSRQWYGAGC